MEEVAFPLQPSLGEGVDAPDFEGGVIDVAAGLIEMELIVIKRGGFDRVQILFLKEFIAKL